MDPRYVGEHTGLVFTEDRRTGKDPKTHYRFVLRNKMLGSKQTYSRGVGEEFELVIRYDGISFEASAILAQAVAKRNNGEKDIDLEHILDEPAIPN